MPVKVYDGTNWVTVAGDGQQGAAATSSSIATWVKTASGGETTLSGNDDNSVSLSYTAGQELLYINGVLQKRAVDYVASTGTSITGLNALVAGDVVTVWTVNAFSVTNAISNSTVTTTGDIIYASAANTPARLGIGTASQVLAVNSGATAPEWKTIAAGGKVLQVIMGSTATQASNSTTTAADTGLTATITPTLNTSKVLVLVAQQGCYKSGGNSQNALNLKLLRGATTIQQIATNLFYNTTVGEVSGNVAAAYLDTPATTSATTYKTQFYNYIGAASVTVQIQNVDLSTIILLEIGA
jgi:hypothetical protein